MPVLRLSLASVNVSTAILMNPADPAALDLLLTRCPDSFLLGHGELQFAQPACLSQYADRLDRTPGPVVSASELETCFRQPAAFRGVAKHVIHRLCHVFDGVWVEILQHSSRDFGKA